MTNAEIIKDMRTLIDYFRSEGGATPVCMEEAIDIISALGDKPVRGEGKWNIERDDGFFLCRWRCSVCNRTTTYGTPAYCMHCGAKMTNGGEQE